MHLALGFSSVGIAICAIHTVLTLIITLEDRLKVTVTIK